MGFIHTTTENSTVVKGLLKDLIDRNFRFTEGLLVVLDGSKGLSKAVKDTFGNFCVVQRCNWHKRENVVSYLEEKLQEFYPAVSCRGHMKNLIILQPRQGFWR